MARLPIEMDSLYHIYNRGVDKRDIFIDDGDRLRFIHYLYHCNNISPTPNLTRRLTTTNSLEIPPDQLFNRSSTHEPLVDIFAFVLMSNHFHLMLQDRVEGGISIFMQRLGTGYTMFFNEKNQRSGSLFQGKFKYKAVLHDAQLLYLPHYIHLNPLPLVTEIDSGGSTSLLEKLLTYRWSSLPDYAGRHNFPSIISPSFILEQHSNQSAYMIDLERAMNEPVSFHSMIEDIAIDLSK